MEFWHCYKSGGSCGIFEPEVDATYFETNEEK